MILVLGKSYLWLFGLCAALLITSAVISGLVFGRPDFGFIIVPCTLTFVLISELRSGIAIDSWWRAKYAKRTWQYQALVTWHAIASLAFTGYFIFLIFQCFR